MERTEGRTLLLELIAMLTLLAMAEGGRRIEQDVPILTNTHRRQPQDVWYHTMNNSITWSHPMEVDKLVNYTVYWCYISSGSSKNCDNQENMTSYKLNRSLTVFQFPQPMALHRTAVVATYSDGTSGGLKWSIPAPPSIKGNTSITWTIVGLALLVLCCSISVIFRKLRHMSDISVELPNFILSLKYTN